MDKKLFWALFACLALCAPLARAQYVPSEGNLQSRKEFSQRRLGIFLHWGIYSSYAQGEWYLSTHQLDTSAYKQAAGGFYPAQFDAAAWADAFREAGAGYVTLTSRHHDGFSMYATRQTPFNIVDATPFGRDPLKELTEAVHARGMRMHYYYSLIDWIRPDYPKGSSGVAKDPSRANYNHYLDFEKAQLRELLAYGPEAIWFDGKWDHDGEPDFPWQLESLYSLIHGIDPSCLVGNNHHSLPIDGEDFQMFERDLPGENKSGYSGGQGVSEQVPLETCETMNSAWGYRVDDPHYQSVKQLVHLLVRAASKGANLLLNIGPQANGQLPAPALERLKGMGAWMAENGHTVNGCGATGIPPQAWGVSTGSGKNLYLHILEPGNLVSDGQRAVITVPFNAKPAKVTLGAAKLPWTLSKDGFLSITLPQPDPETIDTIITIEL